MGGVVTANELRKRVGDEHRVVLVDRESRHVFWPSLLWLQVGLREPDKIGRDLATLRKKGIEVIQGEIEAIDLERKTVIVDGSELAADHLVVSLGARLAPDSGGARAGSVPPPLPAGGDGRRPDRQRRGFHAVQLLARPGPGRHGPDGGVDEALPRADGLREPSGPLLRDGGPR